MAAVSVTETFNVPIEKVYEVLTDYEKYPDYVAGTDGVEVIESDESGALVKFSINVIKEFTYTLKMSHVRPNKISWEFYEGDLFKKNNGYWELVDNGDGTTEATYELDLDFKLMVPKMILKKLVNNNLPAMMESYRERMLSL